MKMKIIVGMLSALLTLLLGQGISPVPVISPDADVSKYPVAESIFLNPTVPEYIVAIRTPDGKVQRILHAPLHNAVIPNVSSSVSRNSDGTFDYIYSVSNGLRARSPIQRWALATEEMNGTVDLKHPEWIGGAAPSMSGLIRDRNRSFGWASQSLGVGAGQTVSSFEIVSNLAPGYVTGAFYGAPQVPELTAQDWASMPEDIAARLRKLLATNWDSQSLQIIGPRFAPGASLDAVEDNFFTTINVMKALGTIQAGPVSTELHSRLLTALRGESSSDLQLGSLTKPGQILDPKESEILSTLKITLDWLNSR